MSCVQPSQPSQPSQPADVTTNAPTHEKTWQFVINKYLSNFGSGVSATDQQNTVSDALRHIKDTLKAFGTNPWTVTSSCDSVAAGNNDANDRWIDNGDLVWNTAGSAHSWIVIEQDAIATHYQVCIDLNATLSAGRSLSIIISPSTGFGASFGGGDGTTTARPTALDEVIMINATSWWTASATVHRHVLHIMQSTDGLDTRIIGYGQSSGTKGGVTLFWHFAKPSDPPADWDRPSIWAVQRNASANLMTESTFSVGAGYTFTDTGVGTGTANLAGYGIVTFFLGNNSSDGCYHNTINGDLQFYPITVVSSTTNLAGYYGYIPDMYWAPSNFNTTVYSPLAASDNSRSWVQVGHILFPWQKGSILKVG